MWQTSSGERVLYGAEGNLFRAAVHRLASWLEEYHNAPGELGTGVHVFDELTFEQKLAMLDLVAAALLREGVPAPGLTAVTEGTIGAVFRYLSQLVETEIDEHECELRPMISAAAHERHLDKNLPTNSARCAEWHEWHEMIEELSMKILWDLDWDLPQKILDMDPAQRQDIQKQFRIDSGYFTAVAPDPTPKQLTAIRARLKGMANTRGRRL